MENRPLVAIGWSWSEGLATEGQQEVLWRVMELFHILIVKSNCMPEKSVFLLYAKMYLNKKQKSKKLNNL